LTDVAFWQAASNCIVPMTLISFWETRPPAAVGVARTFMWTTVSTLAWVMIRPIIGLRMSARTNSARPIECGGGTTSMPMIRSMPLSLDSADANRPPR
jgi:chloramphenicol 3-O-phosphotransferase